MEQNTNQNEKNLVLPIVIGGVLTAVTIGVGSFVLLSNKNTSTQNTSSISSTPTQTASPTTNNGTVTPTINATDLPSQKYKDGTYSATGSYSSPGGKESIKVTITVSGNKITKVELDNSGTRGTSKSYQDLFKTGISGVVVGKEIDSANVSGSVNGSSLTGTGFNVALEDIKKQAQS